MENRLLVLSLTINWLSPVKAKPNEVPVSSAVGLPKQLISVSKIQVGLVFHTRILLCVASE